MTTTTAATQTIRSIPAQGAKAAVVNQEFTAFWVNGAGWKVQVSDGTHTTYSNTHRHEHQAVAEYNELVAKAEAEQPVEASAPIEPLPIQPIPASTGTTQRVSDPSHTVLALAATAHDGIVEQGGKLGQATVTQLRSLANKGYLTLFPKKGGTPYSIGGGRITEKGRKRLAEITKADAEAARHADALATVYSYAA